MPRLSTDASETTSAHHSVMLDTPRPSGEFPRPPPPEHVRRQPVKSSEISEL